MLAPGSVAEVVNPAAAMRFSTIAVLKNTPNVMMATVKPDSIAIPGPTTSLAERTRSVTAVPSWRNLTASFEVAMLAKTALYPSKMSQSTKRMYSDISVATEISVRLRTYSI